MGTALTPQQAALIRRYTKQVFLLYDSDQAGLKATFRSGDELLENGVSVRVISLPDGEDPDSYVAKVGVSGFERAAAESVDVFDRKIQILERGGWFSDLRRKREAIDKLVPTIRRTADRVTRDLYVSRTHESVGCVARGVAAGRSRNSRASAGRCRSPAAATRDDDPFEAVGPVLLADAPSRSPAGSSGRSASGRKGAGSHASASSALC